MAMDNALARPDALTVVGVPIDLSQIDTDTYVVAGIADHLTPWQNCYRSTQLLGGDEPVRPVHQRPHRGAGQPAGQPQGQLPDQHRQPAGPQRTGSPARRPSRAAGGPTSWPGSPSAAARRRPHPSELGGGGLRAAGRGSRHLRLRQLRGQTPCTRTSAGRWAPTTSASPTSSPRGARLPAAHQGVRRRRGAAGHQRLLGARRVPLAADREDGRAGHRRRRHRRLRLPADEPDRQRAGPHGAQPRRRQPRHVPRGAGRAGHAVDRDARLGGAEAAVAAAAWPRWTSSARSRSPSRPTARTRSRWRPRPAATATTG